MTDFQENAFYRLARLGKAPLVPAPQVQAAKPLD
jgi:hypothetical protein